MDETTSELPDPRLSNVRSPWPLTRCTKNNRGDEREKRRVGLTKRFAKLSDELTNLAETVARGGVVAAILDLLTRKDAERRALETELADVTQQTQTIEPLQPQVLRRRLRQFLDDWQSLLAGETTQTRELLEMVVRN